MSVIQVSDGAANVVLHLSGRYCVLLAASAARLAMYPFRHPRVRVSVSRCRGAYQQSQKEIHRILLALWAAQGVPPGDPVVDKELQRRRRAVRARLRLRARDVRVLIRGIPSLYAEFSGRVGWVEFCMTTLAPDYYDLQPQDLLALREKLRLALLRRGLR